MTLTRRRLAAAAGLVLAAVMLGNGGFRRLVRRALQLRKMNKELASLKAEEGELKRRLHEVKSSDRAIESAARRELGYVKPGELEYRFPPPAKAR